MSDFLFRYIATALIGFMLVWYGTPELRSFLEAREQPQASSPESTQNAPAAAPEKTTAPTGIFRLRGTRRPAERQAAPAKEQTIQWGAAQEPVTVTYTGPPPDGTDYDWGVLAETSPSYTRDGSASERVSGGTVVERMSSHVSSRGTLARCRILKGQKWSGEVFIPESAIVIFIGPYAEAPPAERDEVIRYVSLKARIEDRKTELREKAVRANPYFKDYQAAARELTAMQKESKELTEHRDRAPGGIERSRLDDELRRMKSRAAELERRLDSVGKNYKEWRAANDDGTKAIERDATLRQWNREYAALEPKMSEIISGL